MPRNPDTTPICSPEKTDCVHEALTIVEQTAFDDSRVTVTNCQCLPSCSNIEYPHDYSAAKLGRYNLLHIPHEKEGEWKIYKFVSLRDQEYNPHPEGHPEFQNDTYVSNNLAVMHIYFDKLHFIMHQRGELYTFTDFLANIGGLMGLCLGISAMSILEFVYFFTARLYFNIVTPRSEEL